jgi:hypothetical protein
MRTSATTLILAVVGVVAAPARAAVQAPPAAAAGATGSPVANECATPHREWIWCDDFEQDRLHQYFEYEDASGRFARAAGVGVKGSFGMRARFARGETSAGALHLALGKVPAKYFRPVDGGTTTYRELYWRMYVRYQPGWIGGVGYKLTRAMSFTSANWAEAMVAHLWGGDPPDTNVLQLDPVSATDPQGNVLSTRYNDFGHFRWLGRKRGFTPLGDAAHAGQWYCVEVHARLNDPGRADGAFEYWVNGDLQAREDALNFVGPFTAYGINAVFFENYWNDGAPAAQERYLDNIVVSTERIGC